MLSLQFLTFPKFITAILTKIDLFFSPVVNSKSGFNRFTSASFAINHYHKLFLKVYVGFHKENYIRMEANIIHVQGSSLQQVKKMCEQEKAGTGKQTLGSEFSPARTANNSTDSRKYLSAHEYHEIVTMCLTSCYAGRTGHCDAAGKCMNQTLNCLALYRQEQRGC